MRSLEEQGFIRVRQNGNKPFGFVLLVNPFLVIAKKISEGSLSDQAWISAFLTRCSEIGAKLPESLETALARLREVK